MTNYNTFTIAQLRTLTATRGIEVKGDRRKKATFIAVLTEADLATQAPAIEPKPEPVAIGAATALRVIAKVPTPAPAPAPAPKPAPAPEASTHASHLTVFKPILLILAIMFYLTFQLVEAAITLIKWSFQKLKTQLPESKSTRENRHFDELYQAHLDVQTCTT